MRRSNLSSTAHMLRVMAERSLVLVAIAVGLSMFLRARLYGFGPLRLMDDDLLIPIVPIVLVCFVLMHRIARDLIDRLMHCNQECLVDACAAINSMSALCVLGLAPIYGSIVHLSQDAPVVHTLIIALLTIPGYLLLHLLMVRVEVAARFYDEQ